MKKSNVQFQLFACLLFLSTMVRAQSNPPDTAFIDQSIGFAKASHLQKTKNQSPLYNGSQYGIYNPVNEEHPYFLSDDWIDGSIVYSGEQFDNISMMYDLSTDKVIAEHFAGAAVELISAKISTFTLSQHLFRYYTKNDDSRQGINNGFYEVLYDGKTKILKRHIKIFNEMVKSSELVVEYDEKTRYYVVKNNAFYSIGSQRSLISILADKKRELRQFSRERKSKSRKHDQALAELAAHYDTLTP